MRLRRLLFGGPRTPEEEAENERRAAEEEAERLRKEREAEEKKRLKESRGMGGYMGERPENKKQLDEAGKY